DGDERGAQEAAVQEIAGELLAHDRVRGGVLRDHARHGLVPGGIERLAERAVARDAVPLQDPAKLALHELHALDHARGVAALARRASWDRPWWLNYSSVPCAAPDAGPTTLRRQVEILADARQGVGHVAGGLVDDRDDVRVGQTPGTDDTEDADDLVPVEVGRGDQRAPAHLGERVLLADRDTEPLVRGERGHEVGEPLLLLEGAEQLARRLDVQVL